MTTTPIAPHLTRDLRIKALGSVAVAAFWATFLWGFWSRGVHALGLNAAAFLLGSFALLLWAMRRKGVDLRANAWWIAPIALVMAGFALYDNPFLKIVSFILLPVLVLVFSATAFASHPHARWDSMFLVRLFLRALGPLAELGAVSRTYNALISTARARETMLKRVLLGVGLLLLLSFGAVVPLLSGADAEFAHRMGALTKWFAEFISAKAVVRVLFTIVFSYVALALLFAWTKPFRHDDNSEKEGDSVVAGIVLGGLLALYALFLWIQAKHLWTGTLPNGFSDVERLVKSGFWQLFWLTVLNIVIFAAVYRRTSPAVQRLLAVFTGASFLLLGSAAQRMVLYVAYYGLSYEKFFASYAVLYCAILLGWLFTFLFVKSRADILRHVATLFLWMYAALAVLPVESVIFGANMALSNAPGTHIHKYEMTMLSGDVRGAVERARASGRLGEAAAVIERERDRYQGYAGGADGLATERDMMWVRWLEKQDFILSRKETWELSLSDISYIFARGRSQE